VSSQPILVLVPSGAHCGFFSRQPILVLEPSGAQAGLWARWTSRAVWIAFGSLSTYEPHIG
jgi:hypothetical protein